MLLHIDSAKRIQCLPDIAIRQTERQPWTCHVTELAALSTINDKYSLSSNLIFNCTDSVFQRACPPLPSLFSVKVTNVDGIACNVEHTPFFVRTTDRCQKNNVQQSVDENVKLLSSVRKRVRQTNTRLTDR